MESHDDKKNETLLTLYYLRAKKMHEEKRQYERFKADLEVVFSSDSFVCSNTILNISMGGLCIECGKAIPPNQGLTILIPTNPPVKVKGKVAWNRKVGLTHIIGIKFQTLTPDQKRALGELISSFFWERQMWAD